MISRFVQMKGLLSRISQCIESGHYQEPLTEMSISQSVMKKKSKFLTGIQVNSLGIMMTLLLLTFFQSGSYAQTTYDWLTSAPDGNWKQGASGAARWNPGGLWDEPPSTSATRLRFNNNTFTTMTNNSASSPYTIGQLFFGSSATTSRTLSGGSLQFFEFGATWPRIENQSTTLHTFNIPFAASTNSGFNMELVASSGNIDFGTAANINNNSRVIQIYGNNIAVDGTNRAIRLSGVLSGAGALNVSQFGVVKLNATHTYTGQTQIDNGELWVEASGSIATGSGIFVGNGGQLANVAKFWISNTTGGTTVTNAITINNGNASTRFLGGLNTSGTHIFSGAITNNSTTGGVNLSALNTGGTTTFSGVISGSSAVTAEGAGTVTLAGTGANTYTGTTTVNGTLLVLNKTAGVAAIPTATTVASGATIRTDAANQWGTGTVPLVTLNGTGILSLNGNNQKVSLASASSTSSVTLGAGTLNLDHTGTNTYAGTISGTGGITKTSAGIQILTNTSNSYSGTTTITGGEIRLQPTANATFSSPVVLNGGTLGTTGITATRTWTSSSTLGLSANSTIVLLSATAHTLTFAASNAVSWTAGTQITITGWSGSYNGTTGTGGKIFVGSNSSGLTPIQLSQIVFNNGTSNFSAVLLGTGELVPSANIIIPWTNGGAPTAWYTNTNWTPSTTSAAWLTSNIAQFNNTGTATTAGINIGTSVLSIGAIDVTSARTRVLTIGNSSATAGNLTLNGAAIQGISNTIFSNNSGFLLTVQDNETGTGKTMGVTLGNVTNNVINISGTGGISISSIISGASRNLTKEGTGTGVLTLSAANTYGGTTTINNGNLTCGVASALPSTTGVTLANTASAGLTLGTFSQTINSLAGGGAAGGNVSVTSAGVLSVNGATNTTYSGVISGTGALIKSGTGILTLANAANSFTGNTTISGGELRFNPVSTTATYASAIILNGGKLSSTSIATGTTLTFGNASSLVMSASSSFDLGSNAHSLRFAANPASWTGTLTINGWTGTGGASGTGGKIFFGSAAGTLTGTQLSQIAFTGFPGTPILLSTGELVPAVAGVTYTWNGSASAAWATPANWTPGTSVAGPTVADNVVIPTAASYTNALAVSGTVTCFDFTVNGTGTYSMAASSNLTIGGTYTYSSSVPATFHCTSTLNISGTGAVSIPAANYGTLNLSGGARTLASSGTIGICGAYTPGSSMTVAGSTVNFNGAGGQSITATTYNNLTISNSRGAGVVTLPAGTISVGGTFDVSTYASSSNPSNAVNAASIFDFTSVSPQSIPAFFYGQLNCTGNGPRTWASSGTIDINQGFSPGTGTQTITGSTVQYSNTSPTTWNFTTFTTNVASRNYNNLILNGGSTTNWSINSALAIGVAGNLTITSGTLQVGAATAGTLNVDGILTVNGTNGTLRIASGAGNGIVNHFGNLVQSAGTIGWTGAGTGTYNFIKSTGIQTITQSGGTISGTIIWNIGNGTTTNTVQLATNLVIGGGTVAPKAAATMDFQTFVLSGAHTFTTISGTTLVSAHASGINASGGGSVQSTTRLFSVSGVSYVFNGTTAQVTGTALNPTTNVSIINLTINNPNNVTLSGTGGTGNAGNAVQLTGTLTLTSGVLILDTRDLQLNLGSTISSSFSTTSMIATIGTNRYNGRLVKIFPSGTNSGLSFTYPLGDITGTVEYTPITISNLGYTGATTTPFVGYKVKDTKHPLDASLSNFLTRYAETTSEATFYSATGLSYDLAMTFLAADLAGTASNQATLKMNRIDMNAASPTRYVWTEDAGSSASSFVLSNTITSASALNDEDFTGRLLEPIYFRSNTSGVFELASNWIVSTDVNFVSPAGVTSSTPPSASNSAGIRIMNGHNMTVSTGSVLDQTTIDVGGILTYGAGSFNFISDDASGTDLIVNGSLVNQSANAVTTTGTIQFNSGAWYDHNVNGGAIPTSTWVAGSECRITGVIGLMPSGGLGQSFSDFTWNCPLQTATALSGALTTIGRDFTITNTNGASLNLTTSTTLALTVGRDMIVNGGTVAFASGTLAGNSSLSVGRDLTISSGSLTMATGTNASSAITGTINRDVAISGAGAFILGGTSSSGAGALTVNVTGTLTNSSSATPGLAIVTTAKAATLNVSGLITHSGTGSTVVSSATGTGLINANGGLTISGGTVNHSTSTTGSGTIRVAYDKAYTLTGGTHNVFTGTGAGTGVLEVGTNSTITPNATTFNLNGGTLNVANTAGAGTGVVNIYAETINLTSGTLTQTAGSATVNFVATGTSVSPTSIHAQTITQNSPGATVSGTITFNIGSTAPASYTRLTLADNINLGASSIINLTGSNIINFSYLDFDNQTLTGGTFNQQSYGVMVTKNAGGFSTGASGALLTTTRNLHSSLGQFSYIGTSPQVTGNAVTNAFNFSAFNAAGLTLSNNLNISASGSFYLALSPYAGSLTLSTFNLTLASTASIIGAGSSNYIITNSTGKLIQTVAAANKDFPVGNSSYNPIRLNNSGTSDTYGVTVVDAVTSPAANDASKLVNRYWNISEGVAGGSTLTASMFMQYNGAEEGVNYSGGVTPKIGYFNGLVWADYTANSPVGSDPYTVSPTGSFSPSVANYTLGVGKDDGFLSPTVSYTWNGSTSSSWATTTNWTPNGNPTGLDNVTIPDAAFYSNELNISGSRTVNNLLVDANGKYTMSAGSSLSVGGTYTYNSSIASTYDCTSSLSLLGSGSITVPAANYGTLILTGGARTLPSSGTIGICGTYTPGSSMTLSGSTVNYNGTGAQTITPTAYNNLTISNARGSANLTSPAGTISVSATFDVSSLSAYTPVVNSSSIFDFTSAGSQTIPAFFYGQLNNSGNGARTQASSGVIDIAQGYTPTTGTTTITGSSIRYSNTDPVAWNLTNFTTNVAGRQYNNLEFAGGATTSWSLGSGVNLGVAGNFVLNGAGTFTVATNATANTMTVDGNVTLSGTGNLIIANTATAALVNSLTVTGNTTISSGSLIGVGSSSGTTVQGNFTTNDLTISGTGAMNLDASSNSANSSVTVNGNMSVTSSTANAVNFGSGSNTASNVFNLKGNLTKSGSGTFGCSGTFNPTSGFIFNKGSGTQTLNYSGAAMTSSNFTVASGSTLQLLSNLTLGSNATASAVTVGGVLDCQGFVISIGNAANAFALQATGTLQTSHTSGVSSTISGFTNANTSWAAGATFLFTGTSQSAGMNGYANISSASLYTVTWQGNTSLTLDKSLSLNVFNFTNSGLVILGNFNISLPSSAGALTGSGFSASKMFVTNGTGILSRAVLSAGTGLPFTWPIGESTGTTEYSPVTIASIASAGINGSIGFRVIDGVQPNMSPATSYISRYWPCTVTGFNATYSLGSSTFTYDAATDVVVGPEASLRGNIYSTATSLWTQLATSSAGSNVLTITSGLAGSFMPTSGGPYDITGRIDVPTYYRSVASGNWTTLTTWEISSDVNFVSPAGVTPSTAPSNVNNAGIFIRNGHAVTVNTSLSADDVEIQSGGTLQLTGNSFTLANGAAATDLTVLSGGTLLCASATSNALILASSATMQVNGLFMQSGSASPDITNSGTINIGATGTYEHARNAGIIPTCTWASGSTCLVSGVGNNMPTGLGQAFHHFTVNTTLTASVNCSGNLTTINGDFNLTTNHATNEFRLSTGTTYTLTVGGNFNITNAIFSPASGGSGPCNLVVNGNTTMTGASSRIDKTGAATVNYTFNGDFTQSAGVFDFNSAGSSNTTVNFRGNVVWNGSILRTNGGTHTINFDKTTGLQTLTVGATFGAGAINWNVAGTSNTLRLLSNLALSNSTQTFTVNSGTTMDFQTFVLSGGNTTFTTGASPTLMIGSPAGITTAGTAAGNIQTLVRTVNATTNYVYNGTANQNSGTLLPSTLSGAGKLTISNTGAVSDNTVTLTNTLPMTTPQLNLTSGLLAIGSGQTLNITSGGTVNATGGDFATGVTGGTLNFPGTGTFTGNSNPYNVSASNGVNFGTGLVTIQSGGVFQINSGGFVNTNAPAYATGSTLVYNNGGNFGRGFEWSSASGKGYPYNVTIQNSTTHLPGANGNTGTVLNMAGNFILNSGSAMYLDFGGLVMTTDFNVLGSVTLNGALSLTTATSRDIYVGGDWTQNTGASFNSNNKAVFLNGTTNQNIGGTQSTTFPFLILNNSAGATLTSPQTVSNTLTLTNGQITLGANDLTMGASAAAIASSSTTRYIVTNGNGRLVKNNLSGTYFFPVGPSSSVFGATSLNNSGTADNISVKVATAPAYTNAVTDNTQMVNLEWTINEGTAGGSNISTEFQWLAATEGSGFDRTASVYHAHHNGTKYILRSTSATFGSVPYISISTSNYTGNLTNQRFVVGNINGILPCLQSSTAGDWNTSTNWVDLVVPPAGSLVCLNHAMTITTPGTPSPQGVTFNTGSSVNISGGNTLGIETGGYIYNNSGATQTQTSGTINLEGTANIYGTNPISFYNLSLNGGATLTTVPTITNQLELKAGGFVSAAPNYGSSSTLLYNTGAAYGRSTEWSSTSGAGFPANVQVSGGTTLNISNGSNTARAISGSFTVDNGSSATMSSMTGNLTIPGNFTLNGGFTQSSAAGGDIVLGGNWNSGSTASFTSNNRDVRFNGTSGTQTIANTASGLQFGFLTIDNTGTGVDLLNTITASTFRVNASRTFNLNSDKIIIAPGGDVLINGTFNANTGTLEYTDGGTFTNNGTFNRGTSTIDFLGTSPGSVVGTVQTNFHNIRLAPSSGINFGGGALRGRVSGTFQLRAGSFVTGNAPIYESGSKLMYSGGGTFNRNLEWDPVTVQKVEVTNNTILKCGINGTAFTHTMADSLIVQAGSTFDMSSPNMTVPTQVGGNIWLKGTMTLSGSVGGDLEVSGDFQNDGGTFTCNSRLTTFNGSLNGSIKGSTNTNFCLLTVNKGIAKTLTATVPFTVSNAGGTIVRVQGGIFDLNGQTMTIAGGSPTLRVDAGFANGQTLRTGGTSITSFTNFRSTGANVDTLGGKVDYSGSGAETLISPVKGYNLLWITGGATKNITQNTRVNDSLYIAPSSTLDFGAGSHILESRGHVVNNGTTSGSGTGKIELKGLSAQNMSGFGTYRNLDVNNTNNVNSSGKPTISGKLNVFAGKVFTGSDTIILGPSATITETLGAGEYFVRGNLKTTRIVGTSAESFGGMGVDLTAGSNLGTVVVNRQSGSAITGSAPCCTGFNSIARNWTITPSVQPAVADRTLTLTWFSDDDNVMDMTNLQLWKRSTVSDPWMMLDAPQDVSASNPRSATWSSVSSFSQFTGADLNNPLPLSLLKFSGRNVNGTGLLNWTMADQKDLKGFRVEKSTDGKNFSDIGFVAPSIDKAAEPNYSFTDRNLTKDSYYRIRITNNDGTSTVSQVVIIRTELLGNADVQLYPNPSASGAQISIDGNVSGMDVDVRIIGTDGRESGSLTGELERVNVQFGEIVKSLPAGVYQIRVVTEEATKTVRLIKQ